MINLGKKVDDVSEAKLLPEDWYRVFVVEEPREMDNRAGTGKNWVISLRTQGNTEPEHNGFRLPVFLPLPAEGDAEEYNQGQSLEDQKIERILKWIHAFDGTVDGENVDIEEASEAYVYIIQGLYKEKMQNSINIFGDPPKHVDEMAFDVA